MAVQSVTDFGKHKRQLGLLDYQTTALGDTDTLTGFNSQTASWANFLETQQHTSLKISTRVT